MHEGFRFLVLVLPVIIGVLWVFRKFREHYDVDGDNVVISGLWAALWFFWMAFVTLACEVAVSAFISAGIEQTSTHFRDWRLVSKVELVNLASAEGIQGGYTQHGHFLGSADANGWIATVREYRYNYWVDKAGKRSHYAEVNKTDADLVQDSPQGAFLLTYRVTEGETKCHDLHPYGWARRHLVLWPDQHSCASPSVSTKLEFHIPPGSLRQYFVPDPPPER